MQSAKILALHHALPNSTSITTLFFRNLLPSLKKRINVQMIWVIYSPERLSQDNKQYDDCTLLDINDFDNAYEILQKYKPDLVSADAVPNFILNAFLCAARALNIPTFGIFDYDFTWMEKPLITKKQLLISNIATLFQGKVPADTENKKKFGRRGRFFFYKYLFLVRTQRAIGMSWRKIIRQCFMYIKIFLTYTNYPMFPQFAADIHFVDNQTVKDLLIKSGFKEETLFLTGSPIFDQVYHRIQKSENKFEKSSKTRVLLLTTSLYEHGLWTRNQRDLAVNQIVSEIVKHNNEFSLVVKIHPSSENLSEYRTLINKIDSSIPVFQEGDVLDFLDETDAVIVFASTTSATAYALLYKKPIVICNFYNLPEELGKKGLAIECNHISSLISSLHEAMGLDFLAQNMEKYITDYHYRLDGLAADRISNVILKTLQNSKINEK